MKTDIALKASIPEMVQRRDEVLQELPEALDHLKAILRKADAACVGQHPRAASALMEIVVNSLRGWSLKSSNGVKEDMRIAMDRALWRSFVVGTPLWGLMDVTAKRQFEKDMDGVPQPATVDNLRTTMEHHFEHADETFRRGLVVTFQGLSREYRSHDGFKIGGRLALTGIQDSWGHMSQNGGERIRDLDRIFWVLDGKEFPLDYEAGLAGIMRKAIEDGRRAQKDFKPVACQTETDYFRVRLFKNGSMHLWFKRDDLVEKANKLIAEHFGNAIGDSHAKAAA